MNTTKLTLLLACSLACSTAVRAEPRYVTLEVSYLPGTNSLALAPYEVAELVTLQSGLPATGMGIWFKRSGDWYHPSTMPLVIAGPATIELRGTYGYATFRIYPESYPPDKSILVAPGAGGAAITLECSTNLVDWMTATNGVYTNQPAAKFFRIRAERIQP